jgi:RNA polymerase sigma-54 factor
MAERMLIKQQLHQKQVQRLVLAPALQQAIKLLPLTNLELIEIIDEELSKNPMLEVKEETADENGGDSQSERKEDKDKTQDLDNPLQLDDDKDFEKYFKEYFDNRFRSYSIEKKEAPAYENFVSKSTTLWDHLNWQANLTFFNDDEKEIARYIIGNVNEDGYLTVSLEEISKEMDASLDDIEVIRKKIKQFDPIGVGSLTLQEVLLTQIDYFEIKDDIARRIVKEDLSLLEKSKFSEICKKLDVSLAEARFHIDVIKSLDPTPGRKYSQEKTFYIIPDIVVTKEDDEYRITLSDEGVPNLQINRFYKELLTKASEENAEARQYLKDKIKKALWFLRSLDQRNSTINKVAKFIVDKQKGFIENGLDYIKPLTLIEVAEAIGVHESTVGRVVANKHIMTPRGVFPLKYFFHKSLTGDFGEEISSLRVKQRIKKLIDKEDKEKPLSDIEVGDILIKENLKIARRTVAKYRKQLSIPPSHIRKRKYWMEESR